MTNDKKHQKVSIKRYQYLCAWILNDKSAFTQATVVFEKYRLIPMNSKWVIYYLVYPQSHFENLTKKNAK